VKDQHAWAVVVQNDSANTLANVAYVLHEVCSLPPERGFALATDGAVSNSAGGWEEGRP
jgi:hypothetical protein